MARPSFSSAIARSPYQSNEISAMPSTPLVDLPLYPTLHRSTHSLGILATNIMVTEGNTAQNSSRRSSLGQGYQKSKASLKSAFKIFKKTKSNSEPSTRASSRRESQNYVSKTSVLESYKKTKSKSEPSSKASSHRESQDHVFRELTLAFCEEAESKSEPSSKASSRRESQDHVFRDLTLTFCEEKESKAEPSSEASSRRESQDHASSTPNNSARPLTPRLLVTPSTPSSSPTTTTTPDTHYLSPPQEYRSMASRQPSSLLDPIVTQRRQQMNAEKTRARKIATDEETFIRQRMSKNGRGKEFPNYRLVELIGKGTYGRVFLA